MCRLRKSKPGDVLCIEECPVDDNKVREWRGMRVRWNENENENENKNENRMGMRMRMVEYETMRWEDTYMYEK